MRFERLDLNLLVVLDALLAERSVSMAAERIHLSQSATSGALGRLRDYFGDELLVQKGRQMILTPRGEELIEPVRQILHNIRTQVVVAPEFDPQVTDRKIAIMASDYAIQVLLADAIAEFEKTAPNMKFDIQALNDSILDVFDRGAVDILITIDYSCSDNHPKTSLFTDDFVVLAYDQNEFVEGSTIDVETYLTLGHVVTKFGRSRLSSFEDWFMRRSSHGRNVVASVAGFAQVPLMLIGTSRIATVHRRLAQRVVQQFPLKMVECPLEIPPENISAQWHESSVTDKAISWVVTELQRIAETNMSTPNSNFEHSKELFDQYHDFMNNRQT